MFNKNVKKKCVHVYVHRPNLMSHKSCLFINFVNEDVVIRLIPTILMTNVIHS